MYSNLTEREKAAVRNVHWLIDHPDQKPDSVTADGWSVFHFRQEKAERRQVSILQYDRLVQTKEQRTCRKRQTSLSENVFSGQMKKF